MPITQANDGYNNRLLLVEGEEDRHFIGHFVTAHNLQGMFTIESVGGVEKLLRSIPTRVKADLGEYLGILVDADETIGARWQSIRDKLVLAGYTDLPEKPFPEGMILQQTELPRLGVWMMPNNEIGGKLEDFIEFLIPPDTVSQGLWRQAKSCTV